jgi:DNA-directed RNA polymerase subunit RPC12/RpoP
MNTHDFLCRACGGSVECAVTAVGQTIRCPSCGTPMTVPTVEEDLNSRQEALRQRKRTQGCLGFLIGMFLARD